MSKNKNLHEMFLAEWYEFKDRHILNDFLSLCIFISFCIPIICPLNYVLCIMRWVLVGNILRMYVFRVYSFLFLKRSDHMREFAPALQRTGTTLHRRQGRTTQMVCMGVVELALHSPLRWMAPVARLSSSATTQTQSRSSERPTLSNTPSKSCWSLWRDCPCRSIHSGSLWLRVVPEYPRRVLVKIQRW